MRVVKRWSQDSSCYSQMWLQEKQNYECDIYCHNLHVRCMYEISNSQYLGYSKYVERFLKGQAFRVWTFVVDKEIKLECLACSTF